MDRYRWVSPRLLSGLVLGFLAGSVARGSDGASESWDAVYIAKSRVGYFHTQVFPVTDRGRPLIRVQVDMSLSFKRNGDPIAIETLYGTIETPEGEVLRLDSRTVASKQEMRIFGDVIDGKMKLTLEGSGQKQTQTLDWGPDVRGPYGAEMSLARNPMQPGQTRDVKTFIPDLNRIGVAKLTAKAMESIVLGGGVRRDLLRVEQVTYADDKPLPGMTQIHWVDASGQILRTSIDALGGMETYRTTKEAALRPVGSKFDLNLASLLKVRRRINNPTSSREIVYDLKLKDDTLAGVIPNDSRQTLTPGADPKTGRLIVKTAGPEVGEPGSETVDAVYLRPNALITSNDDRVRVLAEKATIGVVDPWKKAVAIQHWVFQNVRTKNFETAFAPASEVARDLQGDCSEHSVLTAAMCRSVGIPSRVVVGLLYDEPHQGFGFHMWNEVYVNRRWVAIDSAWDQAEVDASHIKLTDASLDGVSPYEAFLAVVRVFDKLSIDPVEVR